MPVIKDEKNTNIGKKNKPEMKCAPKKEDIRPINFKIILKTSRIFFYF